MTALKPFELHRAETVAEATGLLVEYGDAAVPYCGGTELLLLMKLGLAAYDHLVDIKPIAELAGIDVHDGALRVGAAVTHRAIERSPAVARGWPQLMAMERQIANIRVRATGTLGGNLAFADPHSDLATFLLVAEADLTLGHGADRRRVPMSAFVDGPWTTTLRRGELVVAIHLSPVPERAGLAHLRFAFHERPAVTVSCLARIEGGRVTETRLAVGSVGPVPLRIAAAEALLVDVDAADPDPAVLAAAGEAAATLSDPIADSNGSVDYKAHLVSVLVGRAVRAAIDDATAPRAASTTA
jgi:carbon-monoxide dehydrogenase medium subunit